MLKRLLIAVISVLASGALQAQPGVPKRALRLYSDAVKLRALHRNLEALASMEKAIKVYPAYEDAYTLLGAWYFQSHRYKEAAALYQQAGYNCPNGQRNYARLLATSYLYDGRTMEALYVIRSYGNGNKEWKKLEEQAGFIKEAMANPWPDTVFNLGVRVNTRAAEMYPCISADGNTLFFTRRTNGIDEDLYRSEADSCGGWFSAKPLRYPINTESQEASQMISADRHYMFFTRCDNRSPNGWEQGGCDLYMAYTADSVWSVPQSFGATINTPGYEGMPCLSSDNRALYFVSDRPGGFGGLDIWVSRFEHSLWQEPQNLGPSVNTAGNETAPFLFADNETLFFSSDGHPGLGGNDLFVSHRTGDSSWTQAQNLGYPINTPFDEAGICVTVDGKKAYFASNRDSVEANYDLYETLLPAALQPRPVIYVKCIVYDSLTKEPLNYASVFVSDANGKELYHYTSNRGDGSLVFPAFTGQRYQVYVNRISYQEINDTISYAPDLKHTDVLHPLAMLPFGYEAPVEATADTTLLAIYFRKNSTDLSDSIKSALHALMQHHLGEKSIKILINGYTDNSGTPLINEQISYKRADLVGKELMTMGFPADIITTQGWGEANPKADNDSEEHKDMNRRVEIVIRK